MGVGSNLLGRVIDAFGNPIDGAATLDSLTETWPINGKAVNNFKKLGNILNKELLKHNIFFIYGLPNRAFYVVSKRLLGMRDIVKLDYYVYPINHTQDHKGYQTILGNYKICQYGVDH